MLKFSSSTKVLGILFSLLIVVGITVAQIPIKIPKKIANPFEKDEPLTSSLADAVTEISFLDNFNPQENQPLSILPYEENNGFMIREPGGYVFLSQSYCLKAGAFGPGSGKGYLYAPLKGSNAEIIRSVLRRSVNHPEIPQHDIQVLLWAIIAKTKPSKMNSGLAETTRILLTPEEVSKLEGSAFEEVSNDLFRRALGKLPRQTQQVFEAERRLREGFTTRTLPFEEVERIAVLAGDPLPSKDDRVVPLGRWSYQPDGYFIRYFPHGYSKTRIEVYFPEQFAIEKDTKGRITTISHADGRRLSVEYDDSVSPLKINKESSLNAYAFKSVRLQFTFPRDEIIRVDLGTIDVAEWTNSGWVFSGELKGKGKISQTEPRFNAAKERYEYAKSERNDLQKLADNLKTLEKKKGTDVILPTEFENLFDLMQFTAALKDLFAEKGIKDDQQFFDPIEFVQSAWASEFVRSVKTPEISKARQTTFPFLQNNFLSTFQPVSLFSKMFFAGGLGFDGGGALPGQTGRQRLGMSDRPHEPDNRCAENYKKCKDQAFTDYMKCTAICIGPDMPDNPTKQQMNQSRECMRDCAKRLRNDKRDCSTIAQDCLEN
jgi:hypothetical protein